jgi:hypothetical protein
MVIVSLYIGLCTSAPRHPRLSMDEPRVRGHRWRSPYMARSRPRRQWRTHFVNRAPNLEEISEPALERRPRRDTRSLERSFSALGHKHTLLVLLRVLVANLGWMPGDMRGWPRIATLLLMTPLLASARRCGNQLSLLRNALPRAEEAIRLMRGSEGRPAAAHRGGTPLVSGSNVRRSMTASRSPASAPDGATFLLLSSTRTTLMSHCVP